MLRSLRDTAEGSQPSGVHIRCYVAFKILQKAVGLEVYI